MSSIRPGRLRTPSRIILGLGLGLTAVAVAPLAAQSAPAGRTSWGDPDLQGTWNYGTMTPMERPQRWADVEILPEEEALEYERQTVERRSRGLQTAGPDWWEPQNNVLRNRRTALVVDPPDGRIPPMTAEATASRRAARAADDGGAGPYDDPERLNLRDRCIAWEAAGPPMIPTVYNNNVLIVQTPDHVVLLTEMIHNARVVPIDGSPHGTIPSMHGDPRGHWEGDTLVVESVGFDGSLPFRGSTTGLHLVERFNRAPDGGLTYRFTVDDPEVWTGPWTVRIDMGPADGPIFEFGCHEGNERSVSGILSGARYEEHQAALSSGGASR